MTKVGIEAIVLCQNQVEKKEQITVFMSMQSMTTVSALCREEKSTEIVKKTALFEWENKQTSRYE